MFGDYSGRIRTLSDSVGSLTQELQAGRMQYSQSKKIEVNNSTHGAILAVARSIDALTSQLQQTNTNLSAMARNPLFSAIAGRAEAELQSLVRNIDAITTTLQELRRLAGY